MNASVLPPRIAQLGPQALALLNGMLLALPLAEVMMGERDMTKDQYLGACYGLFQQDLIVFREYADGYRLEMKMPEAQP